jgi:leucyl aminopeptidase
MKILFAASASGDAVAAPVYADRKLSDAAKALDSATSGAVTRAIEASRFKGGAGDLLEIAAPAGVDATRIVLFGLGEKSKLDGNGAEKAVAGVIKSVLTSGAKAVSVHLDGDADQLCRGALGATLASYRFDTYRTKLSEDKKPSVTSVEMVSSHASAAEKLWADWGPVAEGVTLARDLVNEPANALSVRWSSPPAPRRCRRLASRSTS